MELIFEIRDAEEGGYYARALGLPIFTEAETWDELRKMCLKQYSCTLKAPRNVLDLRSYIT